MIFIFTGITALLASFLTFFSGFGLGTILLPVFAIYFPFPVAVALTAVVHLLNNIFKLSLVFKNINYQLILKFGVPSAIAAFAGAYCLKKIGVSSLVLFSAQVFNHNLNVTLQGLIIGALIIFFSVIELSKKLSSLTFNSKYLVLGGFISGFFGGFSGHQGAIRSAFLLRLNLDKQAYIATGVVVACMIDVVRLFFYSNFSLIHINNANLWLLLNAVLCAWCGALLGNKLFKKTSIAFFKWFVALFMMVMGLLIIVGIV